MTRYLVGLGSNLGDRAGHIAAAVGALRALPAHVVVSRSRETAPMYLTAQPWFLNCVAVVDSPLDPHALLDVLLAIERRLGRVRTVPYGPRPIDLDLIAAADQVIDTPALTVPHPRLAERRFVLEPLAEVAPEWVHPILARTARDLLAALDAAEAASPGGVA